MRFFSRPAGQGLGREYDESEWELLGEENKCAIPIVSFVCMCVCVYVCVCMCMTVSAGQGLGREYDESEREV